MYTVHHRNVLNFIIEFFLRKYANSKQLLSTLHRISRAWKNRRLSSVGECLVGAKEAHALVKYM